MSPIELWTWIAIGVLVIGSSMVFLWFVRDLIRMSRGDR